MSPFFDRTSHAGALVAFAACSPRGTASMRRARQSVPQVTNTVLLEWVGRSLALRLRRLNDAFASHIFCQLYDMCYPGMWPSRDTTRCTRQYSIRYSSLGCEYRRCDHQRAVAACATQAKYPCTRFGGLHAQRPSTWRTSASCSMHLHNWARQRCAQAAPPATWCGAARHTHCVAVGVWFHVSANRHGGASQEQIPGEPAVPALASQPVGSSREQGGRLRPCAAKKQLQR